MHRADGSALTDQQWDRTMREPEPVAIDWDQYQFRVTAACTGLMAETLGRDLGVSATALNCLGLGWDNDLGAWTFPMLNQTGDIIGIRTRYASGRKRAVKGSKAGLFYSPLLSVAKPVLVVEGPTDAAAAIDLGFDQVVGRPSCTGGAQYLTGLLPVGSSVVIVADNDGPGTDGAKRLADRLAKGRTVRVVHTPRVKDLREFVRAGGTRAALADLIDSRRPWRAA